MICQQCVAYLFYVPFAGLGIGLGLKRAGLGLDLGLGTACFGLDFGLERTGLHYNTVPT